MVPAAGAGRVAGVAGAVGAALALGAAVGVATERIVVRRAHVPDYTSEEPFGLLRGRVVPVTATDGTALHVEVEEPTPGSVADKAGDGLTIVFCHGYALKQDCWHYQRRDLRRAGAAWCSGTSAATAGPAWRPRTTRRSTSSAPTWPPCSRPRPPGRAGRARRALDGRHDGDGVRRRPPGAVRHAGRRRRPDRHLAGGLADVTLGLPAPLGADRSGARRPGGAPWPGAASSSSADARLGSDLGFVFTRHYSFGSEVPPALAGLRPRMLCSTPIDVVAEFLPTLDAPRQARALHALQNVETLVLVGDKDLMTPPSHSEAIAELLPGAEWCGCRAAVTWSCWSTTPRSTSACASRVAPGARADAGDGRHDRGRRRRPGPDARARPSARGIAARR